MLSGDKVFLGSSGCPGTLCEPGWPQTHRNVPASASRVPRLKGVALGTARVFLTRLVQWVEHRVTLWTQPVCPT